MRVRILGGGIYGCHLAVSLLEDGHEVRVYESADRLFAGASGNMPARLHLGFHYPRSKLTRAACLKHGAEFMARYGVFTHAVPTNIYAVAETDSLVDFGTYRQIMEAEDVFLAIQDPAEFGLRHVEGALLTGERHVLVDPLRDHFAEVLEGHVEFDHHPIDPLRGNKWDMTIDCTFCAHDAAGVDRYEACLTLLLAGPTDRAVTIMDGGFPSLYPWDEEQGLSSLTSAKWTPFAKTHNWREANCQIDVSPLCDHIRSRAMSMFDQMAFYYPRLRDEYRIVDHRLAIRAMPRSAADARLVDVVQVGDRLIRVRAGKLDAIFHAERLVKEMLHG